MDITEKEGSLLITPEGSEAFSTIFQMDEADQGPAATFIKSMMENSVSGDHSQFQQAIGWGLPPEEAAQMADEFWQELRGTYGETKSIDILGVYHMSDNHVTVFVAVNCGDETIISQYVMEGSETIKDLEVFWDGVPGKIGRSNGQGGFVMFDVDTGISQKITVEKDDTEGAIMLHLRQVLHFL